MNLNKFGVEEIDLHEQVEIKGGEDETFGQALGRGLGRISGLVMCTAKCFMNLF